MSAPTAGGLMVVVAHPDDETFGVGGTMALLRQRGEPVSVLIATRGQSGQIVLPELDTEENRADMAALREREARAAMDALGVERLDFLDHRDGQLAEQPQGPLAREVATALRRKRPAVVVTFGPEGIYGHPDHLAIHRATTRAFELAADPEIELDELPPHAARRLVFNVLPRALADRLNEDIGPIEIGSAQLRFRGYAEAEIRTRVNIASVLDRKLAALAAHASQTGGDSDEIRQRLGDRVGTEHFIVARDRGPAVAELDHDLLAGLPPAR